MELPPPARLDVQPITLYGHHALSTRCRPVTEFDGRIARLVDRMFETMYATANGVGLAATQVGRTVRVFVFDCHDGLVGHVINPELEISDEEQQNGPEGCLSLPGLTLDTPRALHAAVTGFDVKGRPVRYEGSGLRARCFQHEVGHLDGRVFIDEHTPRVRRRAVADMKAMPWFGTNALDPRSEAYQRYT